MTFGVSLTTAIGSAGFGIFAKNGNFFTRLLFEIKDTVEALTELENHVHGNKAERRKSGKSLIWTPKIRVKAMYKTRASKRGLSNDQKIPRVVLLY